MSGTIAAKYLFVDFENIQKFDLALLPEGFAVTIFVGSAQKSIPTEMVQSAQAFGTNLEWLKVEGGCSNALDFHLTFYLGGLMALSPQTPCYILSKDSGFDPLLRHLKQKGLCCRRISSLLELQTALESKPKTKINADALSNYERVVKSLKPENPKPRSRKTLENYIAAAFQKQISEAEARAIDTTPVCRRPGHRKKSDAFLPL